MSEKIEDQVHELDEKKRRLDQEIESLEQEASTINCKIIIMTDSFSKEAKRISRLSAPRSGLLAEKVTERMEEIGKKRAEAIDRRNSLSKLLESKMKERDSVLQEREKMQKKYPEVFFRLCR